MDINALRGKLSADINVRDLLKLLRTPIGKGKQKKEDAQPASPEKVAAAAEPRLTPAQAVQSALRSAGIVLGIGAALATIPWWFGKRTEAAYEAFLASAAGPFVTVKPVNYERGWLGSRAETELSFGGNAARITLASMIHHGPFPGFSEQDFTPRLGSVQTEIVGRIAGLPRMLNGKARVDMSLRGETLVSVDVPGREFDLAGGARLTLRPLTGSVTIDADGNQRSEWKTPLLRVASSIGLIGAENAALTVVQAPGGKSSVSLALGALSFDTLDDSLRAEKLKVEFPKTAAERGMKVTAPIVRFGSLAWGPGEFELLTRRLDDRAVAKFLGAVTAPPKKNQPPPGWGEPLVELGRTLARQKTEFEIPALSVTTPHGAMSAHGRFTLSLPAGNEVGSPLPVLRAASGESEVRVPGAVLRAYSDERQRMRIEAQRVTGGATGALKPEEAAALTPEQVTAMVAERSDAGLAELANRWHLAPAPEGFVHTFKLSNGQLLLNGEPITFTPAPATTQ